MEFSGLKRIFDFFWNNNISPLIDRIPSIFKDEMPDVSCVNQCVLAISIAIYLFYLTLDTFCQTNSTGNTNTEYTDCESFLTSN